MTHPATFRGMKAPTARDHLLDAHERLTDLLANSEVHPRLGAENQRALQLLLKDFPLAFVPDPTGQPGLVSLHSRAVLLRGRVGGDSKRTVLNEVVFHLSESAKLSGLDLVAASQPPRAPLPNGGGASRLRRWWQRTSIWMRRGRG